MAKMRNVKRFPRLIEGGSLGEVLRASWKKPHLTIRNSKNWTEFIFRVPSFLRVLKKEHPGYFRVMFVGPRKRWSEGLLESYKSHVTANKKVSKVMEQILFDISRNTLHRIITETASYLGEQYKQWEVRERATLRKKAKRKTGPKIKKAEHRARREHEAKLAGRLRHRYEILKPEVREFRAFIKSLPEAKRKSLVVLQRQINRQFSYKWIPLVYGEIETSNIQRLSTGRLLKFSLLNVDWATRDLTLAIISSEEKKIDTNFPSKGRTIYRKYISGGASNSSRNRNRFRVAGSS